MDDQSRLIQLFKKHLDRRCSPEEIEELVSLLQEENADTELSSTLLDLWKTTSRKDETYPVDWEQLYQRITSEDQPGRALTRRRRLYQMAAIFVGLLAVGSIAYLGFQRFRSGKPVVTDPVTIIQDIPPGKNKATLTLDDGKTLVLDPGSSKEVVRLEGIKVIKLDSGYITYQPQERQRRQMEPRYNTLRTPRGGQYRLQLPDGTKVWLNAASSIRYPIAFSGNERRVEITGEVYLEVSHDAAHPFVVDLSSKTGKKGSIEVLGTSFNVNAYDDEAQIKTTLVEGRVKISSSQKNLQPLFLNPGEQAGLSKNGSIQLIQNADISQVLSWKEGLFVFRQDKLPDIMRRLSRWYDVEIIFQDDSVLKSHFTGTIKRQEDISNVLKMLELTGGARFEIDGRRIIITNPK